jgi:5-formyltetrahydrofolate cyclo-ligase
LRARIVRDRDAMSAEDRARASASIAATIAGREDFASSKAVLLTLPFGSEWDQDAAPGYRGILEPGAHCALLDLASIDWVLVPGVAFDRAGRRLGYGGGYYDRLLPQLRPDAHRAAGAFELQLVERVPAAAHDVVMDALVTEKRSFTIAR